MKQIILILIAIFSSNLKAQNHAFKANPLSLVFDGIEISYEMMNENKSSTELVFAYISSNKNDQKLTAYGAELRYKFLLSKDLKSFEGYYLAPIGSIISGKVALNNYSSPNDLSVYGIGVLGGYQFIFQNEKEKGFVIDLHVGFVNNFVKSTTLDVSDIKGLKPRIGISLGYAF